jgi:hypothetical protein
VRRIGIHLAVCALLGISTANGAIVSIGLASFAGANIEEFNGGAKVQAPSFQYGRFSHLNLLGHSDYHRLSGGYGLGDSRSPVGGRSGDGFRYFATSVAPTTFQLDFSAGGGLIKFGFYGAEGVVLPPSAPGPNDGQIDLEFLDAGNNLLGALTVDTLGTFAWDQFHGFESTTVPIALVRFRNVGYMVMDDLHFMPVPEPSSFALTVLGLIGRGLEPAAATRVAELCVSIHAGFKAVRARH